MNVLSLCALGYYAVTKGMDFLLCVALGISMTANILSLICEVKHEK